MKRPSRSHKFDSDEITAGPSPHPMTPLLDPEPISATEGASRDRTWTKRVFPRQATNSTAELSVQRHVAHRSSSGRMYSYRTTLNH